MIYSVGDSPGGMYGLVAGSLAISSARRAGAYVAHFAQPGTWFGEGAAFTDQPRRIALAVTRDSEVLHLPLPAIREIVAADPVAWRYFGLAAGRPQRHRHRRRGRSVDPRSRQAQRRGAASPGRMPVGTPRGTRADRGRRQPGRLRHDDQYGAHDRRDRTETARGRGAVKVPTAGSASSRPTA